MDIKLGYYLSGVSNALPYPFRKWTQIRGFLWRKKCF